MVNIKDVRASNEAFKHSNISGLVAVFVGATSGIGMGTLKQFTKAAKSPKIYVIGRSQSSAAPLLDELKASNSQAKIEFIETEISLIKNVDLACDVIKSKEQKVDILCLSPGFLAMGGRQESTEGIDIPHALRYYTRLRFFHSLLPLLLASDTPRVISILAGGKESKIDLTDLEVKKDFTFIKAAENGTTQTTLAFEELAKTHPSITFIHKYPGFVNSGVLDRLMGTAKGIYAVPATIVRWLILPIANWFSMTVDEAGERGLFLATSARFPPAKPKTAYTGQELPRGVEVANSSIVIDGRGNGVYRLSALDDSTEDTPALISHRAENAGKIVWETTEAVWDRALSRSS